MTETKTYGLHLMIDGYGADPAKLDDAGLLFETLNDLPSMIGMRKLSTPVLARVDEKGGEGISGIVMIYESHISIHTYPKKGFFSMDVYSCNSFDAARVVDAMRARYAFKDAEVQAVDRAKRFPVGDLHP